MRRRRRGAHARPAAGEHHQDCEAGMGEHQRAQEPQPGRRVLAGSCRHRAAVEGRRQAVANTFEPKQMQEQKHDEADRRRSTVRSRRAPRARARSTAVNTASAPSRIERRIRGEQHQRRREAEHVPGSRGCPCTTARQ